MNDKRKSFTRTILNFSNILVFVLSLQEAEQQFAVFA
jgi:hypothetical protein